MKTLTIPYGKSGWQFRKSILRDIIASRTSPPFLYNDVLLIVPSSRTRRVYGRLLLDVHQEIHGSSAMAQPEILTLHQFIQKLYAARGDYQVIDENSRLVLLEGIVKERLAVGKSFRLKPDLLAPALSAAVAAMIEELSQAGIAPARLAEVVSRSELSEKQQVRLLVDVYETYESVLVEKGLLDPAGLLVRLDHTFDANLLARYSRIIIDGLQRTNALLTPIFRKIAGHGNCTFLITAPSAESIATAGAQHPLRPVQTFVNDLGLTLETGPMQTGADDQFVAAALFSDSTFTDAAARAPAEFPKIVNLLSAVNMREEVSCIAREVKTSLRAGIEPDSILVAFPFLDEYGPLAEEIFRDFGIPYNRALGRQLSASPVATAVVSLLAACREDYAGPALLRVVSSPFLKFSKHPSLGPSLDNLMRRERIIQGMDRWLAAARRRDASQAGDGQETLAMALQDLFAALEPFSTRELLPLTAWMERLGSLMAWSGIAAQVELIKGPLNVNQQAFRKLQETLGSLARAGRLFPEYRYTVGEWQYLLKKTFLHARFQVPPDDEGGVQIIGLEEIASHDWSEIYAGGMIDGRFPLRLPQNIFLPEATLESLGLRMLEDARLNAAAHFYRIALSSPKVTFTWPENLGDKPAAPSPFLEELKPLSLARLLNRGLTKTAAIQSNLRIEESLSMTELAKSIGLAAAAEGLQDVLSADIDGMAGIKAAIAFDPLRSDRAITPPPRRRFRVTELDDYLQCPFDYYVKHILGIMPLEDVTEDMTALDRGSKVHAILRNFYVRWKEPVLAENRAAAMEQMRFLAERAFADEADTFRNRREKDLFLNVMAPRFLDAEEAFWKQGMQPAYLEQRIESFTITRENGSEVEILAKIDRIDVDDAGHFIIVDYKTGSYPEPKMDAEQVIFQLPLYALMARTSLAGISPALKKPIGLAYYDLAGKNAGSARDVVLYDTAARDDHPTNKPKASAKSPDEFENILIRSLEKARQAIEGIVRGEFPSTPRDGQTCRYCRNEMLCGSRSSEQ